MLSQPLPRSRRGTRAAAAAALATVTVIGVPANASAGLIPAPGPWPTNVAGATNPLVGTPFVLNGGHATANAALRVWLPDGRQRRNAITRTVGQHVTIRGRLLNRDDRHSISGATLVVAVQNVYMPGDWTAVGTVRTNRRGGFRTVLGPGYHRRAALLYYPNVAAVAPISSRRVLIRARSRVVLARPFHRGRSYRFDGQVSAGAVLVPISGLLVALQVRNRNGNWVSARLRRTGPSGRFHIRYRFPTRARLYVRIAAPSQSGWALYAGYSRVRQIRP
jgi:hypothetical protein